MTTLFSKHLNVFCSLLLSLSVLSACNNDQTPPPDQSQDNAYNEDNNPSTNTDESDTTEDTTNDETAHNDSFHVVSPKPGDSVDYTFTVSGEAQVFEGTFAYRLIDEKGEELVREYVQVDQSDEEGEGLWRSFEFTVYLDDHTTPSGTLYLYEESEKDGTADNELEIPLKFIPSE